MFNYISRTDVESIIQVDLVNILSILDVSHNRVMEPHLLECFRHKRNHLDFFHQIAELGFNILRKFLFKLKYRSRIVNIGQLFQESGDEIVNRYESDPGDIYWIH